MRYAWFDYGLPLICMAGGIGFGVLTAKYLPPYPDPVRVEDQPAFRTQARWLLDAEEEADRQRCRSLTLEMTITRQAAELDALRRGAQWLPPKPPELDAADMIPPQNVPVTPATLD